MDFYTDIKRPAGFRKSQGAHFTPSDVVVDMCSTALDMLDGFDPDGFKFLDLASGTGVFSFYLARLIEKRFGMDFKDVINNCCYMSEMDPFFIEECKDIYSSLGCTPKIIEGDSLFEATLYGSKFDIVISNPPYIRIQNLEAGHRNRLQANYQSCSFGSADIYLAFMELGLGSLKHNGVFSFITPSSYLRSDAGKYIRRALVPFVREIKDFGTYKHFNCGAYTAVTYAKKNYEVEKDFKYVLNNKVENVDRYKLENKLILSDNSTGKLNTVCKIRGGLATLRDKVFIVTPDSTDDAYAYVDGFKIERAATKKFVKLSKVKTDADIRESNSICIYPYKDTDKGYVRYVEGEFKSKFPGTYKYLSHHKEELLKRDRGVDKGYKWFEFGRSQGLGNIKECIVTSMINNAPNFIVTNLDEMLVGSGLILYDNSIPLRKLVEQLNSEEMAQFISVNGTKYANNWYGYSKKILGEFPLTINN